MTDKWTMGSNSEGLYNGKKTLHVKKEKKKGDQETTTVAPREHNLKEFILSKIIILGFNYNSLKSPKPHSLDVES